MLSGNRHAQVIGIGSPSGDDQAGWLVVQGLAGRMPPEISLIKLDRPGAMLIPLLEKADRVILIDAMQGGAPPGEIRHFVKHEWADYRTGLSSHGLGVLETLMLARELGCIPENLDLYGIEIDSVKPGDALSEEVVIAAGKLANRIIINWYKPD